MQSLGAFSFTRVKEGAGCSSNPSQWSFMSQTKSYRDLIGQVIQDMKVERLLHESAQGVVFLVRQVGIGRAAVLKLLPQDVLSEQRAQRFLVEASTLSQLRHANVATLYDVGMFQGRPYVVTEYIPGEPLATILEREGPLAPDRALGIIQQVIHALEEAHKQNILHQNLSLQNIMIESLAGSNQDLVKLINFGSARVSTQDEDDLTNLERVLTMTPEEGLGATYTPSSEVYVCGVMLYQLLTGYSPYQGQNIEELWDEIVSGTPVSLHETLPSLASYPELQPLMSLFLSKKASLRPATARNARLHIGQCLTQVQARSISLGHQPSSSFPVINTVEHVPALPRETPITPEPYQIARPGRATWAASEDMAFSPESDDVHSPATSPDHVTPSVDEAWDQIPVPAVFKEEQDTLVVPALPSIPSISSDASSQSPDSHEERSRPVRRLDIDLKSLRWLGADSEALRRMEKAPSLLFVLASYDTQLPAKLVRYAKPALQTKPPAQVFFLVCEVPEDICHWMTGLLPHVLNNHLRVGVTYVRRLEKDTHLPPEHTLRMALRAAERAEEGDIIASRHAVNIFEEAPAYFEELEQDEAGRYSSFLRLVPTS